MVLLFATSRVLFVAATACYRRFVWEKKRRRCRKIIRHMAAASNGMSFKTIFFSPGLALRLERRRRGGGGGGLKKTRWTIRRDARESAVMMMMMTTSTTIHQEQPPWHLFLYNIFLAYIFFSLSVARTAPHQWFITVIHAVRRFLLKMSWLLISLGFNVISSEILDFFFYWNWNWNDKKRRLSKRREKSNGRARSTGRLTSSISLQSSCDRVAS